MGHPDKVTGGAADEQVARWLRLALRHLYDPVSLRASPLFELLQQERTQSPSALRSILVDAIEKLKPEASVSPQSDAWRTYHALVHRYVEQFSQSEVAASLGISVRQFRRQESLALQTLADYLRSLYDVRQAVPGDVEASGKHDQRDEDTPNDATPVSRGHELEWLERSLTDEPTDLRAMILGALETIEPLLGASGVRVACDLPDGLPHPVIRRTALRQALLTALTAAVRSAPGGQVGIEVDTQPHQVSICIRPQRSALAAPSLQGGAGAEDLNMARQLVALCGGSLELMEGRETECPFRIRLVLPVEERVGVLVIDDNADALHLIQRYLADSPYAFTGTREPGQALALAEQLTPQIVLLDVMLPEVDGWELLGRLREHPQTRHTPVVVCTILPQEQLALTLGAAGFLRKPFTRAELLSALDHQARRPAQGS